MGHPVLKLILYDCINVLNEIESNTIISLNPNLSLLQLAALTSDYWLNCPFIHFQSFAIIRK